MSVILDLVGSTVLGAFVLIIGLRLNSGIAATADAAKADLNVQESLVDIVQSIEYDFRKIGYGIADPKMSILYADSIRLRFLADVDNNGVVDTVEWWAGPPIVTMPNPRIRALFRQASGEPAVAAPGLGVTEFSMEYRDVDGALVSSTSPVPSGLLSRIWIIETTLKVESPYQVADQIQGTDKMVNAASFWRQTRLASRNIKRHG